MFFFSGIRFQNPEDSSSKVFDIVELVQDFDESGVPVGLNTVEDVFKCRSVKSAGTDDPDAILVKLDSSFRTVDVLPFVVPCRGGSRFFRPGVSKAPDAPASGENHKFLLLIVLTGFRSENKRAASVDATQYRRRTVPEATFYRGIPSAW